MSTDTFRGFPVDLLMALKHHGRALVGNDELYDASQAYTDPSMGSGVFGRALLETQPILPNAPPLTMTPLPETDDEAEDPPQPMEDDTSLWDAYSLLELRDLLTTNKIPFPRTMTKGRAMALLDGAHISPPT